MLHVAVDASQSDSASLDVNFLPSVVSLRDETKRDAVQINSPADPIRVRIRRRGSIDGSGAMYPAG